MPPISAIFPGSASLLRSSFFCSPSSSSAGDMGEEVCDQFITLHICFSLLLALFPCSGIGFLSGDTESFGEKLLQCESSMTHSGAAYPPASVAMSSVRCGVDILPSMVLSVSCTDYLLHRDPHGFQGDNMHHQKRRRKAYTFQIIS